MLTDRDTVVSLTNNKSNTIVLQSYRPHGMPDWIRRSLASVQSWANDSQLNYRLLGDEFLELAPTWYRVRAGRQLTVVADLARLLLIQQCLEEGFRHAVWIDADVIVFNPHLFTIDTTLSYGFCREAWIEEQTTGSVDVSLRINNCVCVFKNDDVGRNYLTDYISTCLSTIRELPRVRDHTEVGTKLLTRRNCESQIPIIKGVGLLSPHVMKALLRSDKSLLNQFIAYQGSRLYAVNLCHFFRTQKGGHTIADLTFSEVINILLQSKGSVFDGS